MGYVCAPDTIRHEQILRDAPASLIDDELDRELKADMDSELKKIRSGEL
jgi:hypothetical protein